MSDRKKLSERILAFRIDRPSEWLMDEFVADARELEQQLAEKTTHWEFEFKCKERLEQQLAEHRWIPVSEQLPDEATPVLVVGNTGEHQYITTAMVTWEDAGECAGWCWNQLCNHYNADLHDADNYEFDDDYEYTHWMPLPTPPEGE